MTKRKRGRIHKALAQRRKVKVLKGFVGTWQGIRITENKS